MWLFHVAVQCGYAIWLCHIPCGGVHVFCVHVHMADECEFFFWSLVSVSVSLSRSRACPSLCISSAQLFTKAESIYGFFGTKHPVAGERSSQRYAPLASCSACRRRLPAFELCHIVSFPPLTGGVCGQFGQCEGLFRRLLLVREGGLARRASPRFKVWHQSLSILAVCSQGSHRH